MAIPLRICGVIDGLAPGGAQRQFVELMTGLAARGYHVSVVIYHQLLFFKPQLSAAGISVVVAESRTKAGRTFAVGRAIGLAEPEVVISFLDVPNAIVEVCRVLGSSRFRLIVSERIFNPEEPQIRLTGRMLLHALSSRIVSNSYAQSEHLIRRFPSFLNKVSTIHNCVNLSHFAPAMESQELEKDGPISFVAVASYIERKNPIRFADAFARLLDANPGRDIRCDWYGDQFTKSGEPYPFYLKLADRLTCLGIGDRFGLHGAIENIRSAYQNATALCLPSLAEGCANVICEAMACGLPIIASKVGDNAFVVEDGISGFLFDPESVDSICGALQRFCDLSAEARAGFRANSRRSAEALFGRDEFLNKWESVIRAS